MCINFINYDLSMIILIKNKKIKEKFNEKSEENITEIEENIIVLEILLIYE